jgi:hypothetical protein
VIGRIAIITCGTLTNRCCEVFEVDGVVGIYDVADEALGVHSARVIKALRTEGNISSSALLRLTKV